MFVHKDVAANAARHRLRLVQCPAAEDAEDRLGIVGADGGCIPATELLRIVWLVRIDTKAAEAAGHARARKGALLGSLLLSPSQRAAVVAELDAAKRPQRADLTQGLLRIERIEAHLTLLQRVVI